MTRARGLMRWGFPTLLALVFWVVNAAVMGGRLDEPGMAPGFFWNMLLFAVVITSINAAAVAWARRRLRAGNDVESDVSGDVPGAVPGLATTLAFGSVVTAAGAALLALGCGIALTAAIVLPGASGQTWSLFGQGMGLVVPLGIVFALIGAVTGDLGANLRAVLAEKSAAGVAPGLVVLLVVSHVLWIGVAWLMLVSARGHLPGA